jgi:ribosomal protein S27E
MGSTNSGIISYVFCRHCFEAEAKRIKLKIGLQNSSTLRVWCDVCESIVADFPLAWEFPLRCDICGEPITTGQPHVH